MTINELHQRVDRLPENLLDEVNDFISALLAKQQKQLDTDYFIKGKKIYFPNPSTLTDVAGSLVYRGKAKTLAEIEQDIAVGIAEEYARR